ncbi:hypothetical protein BKA70DRAFT_1536504 [Coprinopsis sp. MPI-PUGE-AT-0042]|nr:hypothetical protein BKA70DRAFT_1536504 [Coprinopsis sp. MPI-PUGE-AT-0042]
MEEEEKVGLGQSLYDELKCTSTVPGSLPDVFRPPDDSRRLKAHQPKKPRWRRSMSWLEGSKGRNEAAEEYESLTRLTQRRYLHPWDQSLQLTYRQEVRSSTDDEARSLVGTPTLPPLSLASAMSNNSTLPPVEAESTIVLKHGIGDIGESSVGLEISSCQLTSREDIPTIHAVLKCAPASTERVTFVSVYFDLVDNHRVLDLFPRRAFGPANEVGVTTHQQIGNLLPGFSGFSTFGKVAAGKCRGLPGSFSCFPHILVDSSSPEQAFCSSHHTKCSKGLRTRKNGGYRPRKYSKGSLTPFWVLDYFRQYCQNHVFPPSTGQMSTQGDPAGVRKVISMFSDARDNRARRGRLNAGIAVEGVHIGTEVERQTANETEASFAMQTQISIDGWIEGSEARWILKEDSVQKNGLPIETALCMRVRYKPREVRHKYAITITRNRPGGGERQYKGQTTLLFP